MGLIWCHKLSRDDVSWRVMTWHDIIPWLTLYSRNFVLKPFLVLLCLLLCHIRLYLTMILDILLAFELKTTGICLNLIWGGQMLPPARWCQDVGLLYQLGCLSWIDWRLECLKMIATYLRRKVDDDELAGPAGFVRDSPRINKMSTSSLTDVKRWSLPHVWLVSSLLFP